MSKEAVLLQWERKCEVADRLDAGERPEPEHPATPARRFVRTPEPATEPEPAPEPEASQAAEPAQPAEPIALHPGDAAVAERRTITITGQAAPAGQLVSAGQAAPARRRRAAMDAQLAQPDRIALWAFLLGLLLVAVAAGTAHA